jgi:hypothetical protein
MFLKTDIDNGDIVIVSEVFSESNLFSGFSLKTLSFEPDFLPNSFYHITFHEAFQNDVNKIVLDAVTRQNTDSIWNHDNKECLAVSSFQKDWILDRFVLKHEVDKNFADYAKLRTAHSLLIAEFKDLQDQLNGYIARNKELNDEVLGLRDSLKFNETDCSYLRARIETLTSENDECKKRVMELTQKLIDQQREFDQRFADLHDRTSLQIKTITQELSEQEIVIEESATYIGELEKFIQHLQDYIAAKHLEENGLILEKFIQEESDAKKSS